MRDLRQELAGLPVVLHWSVQKKNKGCDPLHNGDGSSGLHHVEHPPPPLCFLSEHQFPLKRSRKRKVKQRKAGKEKREGGRTCLDRTPSDWSNISAELHPPVPSGGWSSVHKLRTSSIGVSWSAHQPCWLNAFTAPPSNICHNQHQDCPCSQSPGNGFE